MLTLNLTGPCPSPPPPYPIVCSALLEKNSSHAVLVTCAVPPCKASSPWTVCIPPDPPEHPEARGAFVRLHPIPEAEGAPPQSKSCRLDPPAIRLGGVSGP